MTRLILGFCLAFALVLSFVIARELRAPDDESGALPIQSAQTMNAIGKSSGPDPRVLATEQAQHRSSWLQVVLARPLFEPSRRPPAEGHSVAAAAPGLPRLSGVVVTPTGRQVIFAGSGGKPVILGEGASLDGFTVQSIAAGEVTVTGPNGPQVLHPSFDPNQQTPVVGGAPRPFGGPGLFGSPQPPPIPVPLPGVAAGEANLLNNLRGRLQQPVPGNVPTNGPLGAQ